MKIFNNFIKKKQKEQSKYRYSLKMLNDNKISKIHYTLRREYFTSDNLKVIKRINILDNHLMITTTIDGEKEPYIKYFFYGDMQTTYYQKNTFFIRIGGKFKRLVIPFGYKYTNRVLIDYKKESDVKYFLIELKKRYYDYLNRFLEMQK
jgi:hypothetical protein